MNLSYKTFPGNPNNNPIEIYKGLIMNNPIFNK